MNCLFCGFFMINPRNKCNKERGEWMCHFLKPLKLTQELSQKMSYSSELWYGSCFYYVY